MQVHAQLMHARARVCMCFRMWGVVHEPKAVAAVLRGDVRAVSTCTRDALPPEDSSRREYKTTYGPSDVAP